MNTHFIFHPNRFAHLFKRDLLFDQRRVLMVAAAVFVILSIIVISLAWDHDRDAIYFHRIWYPLVLLAGGFFFTSLSFNELADPQRGQIYLTLPASNLEKMISKWLLTSISFTIAFTICYWIFSIFIGAIVSTSFFNFDMESFTPFSYYNLWFMGLYMVLQSIFLVGAIAFRRFALVKTILSGVLIAAVFIGVCALTFRIIFWKYFDGFGPSEELRDSMPSQKFIDFIEYNGLNLLNLLLWIVLPLVLWTVSYFKLKEKEL